MTSSIPNPLRHLEINSEFDDDGRELVTIETAIDAVLFAQIRAYEECIDYVERGEAGYIALYKKFDKLKSNLEKNG